MKTYAWLIRREFWERRSVWMLPAIIAVLSLVVTMFGRIEFPTFDQHASSRQVGSTYLVIVGTLFFSIAQLQMALYLLDCLYEDRRDRSILFWKSLPISDTDTVLSKVLMALVIIPAVALVAADITALVTAVVITVRGHQIMGDALWHPDLWLQVQVLWVYVILSTALWYLPWVGWMLVVSAFVKRAPLLWVLMPFLVDWLFETFFLNSHVMTHYFGRWLFGYPAVAFNRDFNLEDSADISAGVWKLIDLGGFLSDERVWIGAAVGAALIFGAIQLRMRRTEA